MRNTKQLFCGFLLVLSLVACEDSQPASPAVEPNEAGLKIPKLVDVGAEKCIPCIKMAPILEDLRNDFSGQMEVVFVNAWENKDEAAKYNVQMIPTQIFYDEQGKELYRHTGFYGREEILGKWQELGYSFKDEK